MQFIVGNQCEREWIGLRSRLHFLIFINSLSQSGELILLALSRGVSWPVFPPQPMPRRHQRQSRPPASFPGHASMDVPINYVESKNVGGVGGRQHGNPAYREIVQ
jgi:hypothetical protein